MKKGIKIGILFILFSFFSFFVCFLEVDALDYINDNYDYTIENYDINVLVNENNTLEIEEVITTNFNVEKHGIYRTIPLKNTINRLDGTTSTNRAKISNVNVNQAFTTSIEENNYVIKIGSASVTLTGEQVYRIRYTYSLGKDSLKDADEFYFNLIGTEWDTIIKNVTFTVTMPKDFDESKLGFSVGSYGSTSSGVVYEVLDNTITGSYHEMLLPSQGLTVRLELEDGYFVVPTNYIDYLMFIIPFLCLLISIFIWYKYGKDDKVIETVEFYPPKNFNSLEVAYLYKGKADNEDVVSLLIYLADKGYLKISEIEEKGLFLKNKTFSITKIKDYDGNDVNEETFFNGLFRSKDTVTENDLTNHFYKTVRKILTSINGKRNKNKIFEKNTSLKKFFVIIAILISLITIVAIPSFEYGTNETVFITLALLLFYTPFYAIGIYGSIPILFRLFWFGFTMFHSLAFFYNMPIKDALVSDSLYLTGFIFGIICIIGMIFCLKYLPKRTPYGNEMLGKIKGFKNFLETVEKEKLESMVLQDPSYFYHILPYTYVLGISNKWIKKFETIALEAPDWYVSSTGHSFSVLSFGSFMNTTMNSAKSSMTSSPSSSGGSSSGGSFSGGGSGGGGGGSW